MQRHHILSHKVNHGLHIAYENISIALIMRDIFGSRGAKEAVIEVQCTANDRDIFLGHLDIITLEHNIQFEGHKKSIPDIESTSTI